MGKIKGGRIEHQDPDLFNNYVTFNFKEDQEVEITVKKRFKKRTSGQPGEETNFNGYYWGVIIRMIGDEIGEVNSQIVSDWVQVEIGRFTEIRGVKIAKSTSDLSGAEFAEMCSSVRMWAGSPDGLNLFIPQPHEVEYP